MHFVAFKRIVKQEQLFGLRKQSLKINKIQKHLRFSDYLKTNNKKNLNSKLKQFVKIRRKLNYFYVVVSGSKDWAGKKVTIPNSTFLIVKSSEMILFFYMHFI